MKLYLYSEDKTKSENFVNTVRWNIFKKCKIYLNCSPADIGL